MISINLIVLIVFYSLLAIFVAVKWKSFERVYKFILVYRTKRAGSIIQKAARFSRFWRVWGYIGIPAVFIGMVLFFIYIIRYVVNLLIYPSRIVQAGGLIVPWTKTASYGPIFTVPITYFLIAVVTAVVLHEFAHAVVSESHGFKIKSAGAGLLAILPFAFVELDEKKLEKAKPAKQLSIFAAGPFMNFCLAGLFLLIMVFGVVPAAISSSNGVVLSGVIAGEPADLAGLTNGDIIYSINREKVTSVDRFAEIMKVVEPGSEVTFETTRGEITSSTKASPDRSKAVIGVSLTPNLGSWAVIYSIFNWLFVINLGLGLFNALPLGPLDGGRMSRTSFLSIFKRKHKLGLKICSYISSICLAFVLMLLLGPTLIKLFV